MSFKVDRVKIVAAKDTPHFIGCWQAMNESICNEIIQFFEKNIDLQRAGVTTDGLNKSIKNSIDLTVNPIDLKNNGSLAINNFFEILFDCYKDYLEEFPFLKTFAGEVNLGSFNIQKYEKGGHFNHIHSERTHISTAHRIFAWMAYLNDIDEGGETFFMHYDLKIKPKKGKVLIWPSEWTHAHSGNLVKDGPKYIITGWMHF